MKKRIYWNLILIGIVFLFWGCGDGRTADMPETSMQQEKTKEAESNNVSTARAQEETETANVRIELNEPKAVAPSKETYDYVALGNSVTCSRVSDGLWWGDWGMAATSAKKDYVHRISKWLKKQSQQPVTTTILDLKGWEVAQDRNVALEDYEEYFNEDTDLITIQTGENITHFKETLDTDFLHLIEFLKEKAPNAQILMLGEILWPKKEIESAKKAACKTYGVTFINMKKFLKKYTKSFRSAIGKKVLGEDGKKHAILDEAVAAHPNDKGMACIAKLVIAKITIEN